MNPSIEYSLHDLADPFKCTDALKIQGADTAWLKTALQQMTLIRKSEEKIGDMVTAKKIVCPCHLAIGQEAVAVGVARHLRTTDRGFGTHRSHSHYLAAGASVEELMAEILGKVTGCSKGMGGSMHLQAKEKGFMGSVPIVAGTVSMAVGAAFAAQLGGDKNGQGMDVGVAYFGDGAIEEGGVHESLNLAANFKLPMLFVCENNLFSSHLHIKLRQPAERVGRFAEAHHIHTVLVDGNDVVAVADATKHLLDKARRGEGPGFLEAVTYRHRGHVGPREDDDVGLKRKDDLNQWKKRDPIKRLKDALIVQSMLNESDLKQMEADVTALVEDAWQKAEAAPYPANDALLDLVYQVPPQTRWS
ncbi:MAG: thiamine pyrophosphate-dependent dehydrogenase E1 component subunit alpha [Bdellovibrionales bacterium]